MNKKKLTIVIPSFNHEKYVLECLNAIKKINNCNFLVIDDGSTDKTPELISEFIEKNALNNWGFVQKKNEGLISSLNLALEMIETEYIYVCASDDIPNPSGVDEALNILINSNADFFIGGGFNFFETKKIKTPIYSKRHDLFFEQSFQKRKTDVFMNYPSPILIQSTLFRVDLLKKVGGWNPKIILDDYQIFAKILCINSKFIYNKDLIIVNYRHHEFNSYRNIWRQFVMTYDVIEKMAPIGLKDAALIKNGAFYCLLSFKNKRIFYFFDILRKFEFSKFPKIFIEMLKIIKNKYI